MTGTRPGRFRATSRRCVRQRSPSTCSTKLTASSPPSLEVELEGSVDRPVQREVPLAGVLDSLTTGADLELDQTEVGVVGRQRLGDPAQVVDGRAGGERVA